MLAGDQIWSRLQAIFCDILDLDEIALSPATTANDVPGWDSITNVQLMVAIEKEFGFRFRTGEMAHMQNVGQLVERIEARGERGRA